MEELVYLVVVEYLKNKIPRGRSVRAVDAFVVGCCYPVIKNIFASLMCR